jgi:hypothetical protein
MKFFDVITAAIRDIEAHGYDTQERIDMWIERIRTSARAALVPEWVLQRDIAVTMQGIYKRMIERGDIFKVHPGVSRFTVDMIKPKLRGELDRRVMASANLIKLNRQAMIEKTTQRFAGWASSVPPGGSNAVDVKDVKTNVRKALTQLPFEERRVLIDQGHKFTSELNNLVAKEGGAIAAEWHSHFRQAGYNYREDHKERDSNIYVIRGSWADERGLITKGAGYTDDITKPAEEPFCRCNYRYIYALRGLPDSMLTSKGRAELLAAREAIKAM